MLMRNMFRRASTSGMSFRTGCANGNLINRLARGFGGPAFANLASSITWQILLADNAPEVLASEDDARASLRFEFFRLVNQFNSDFRPLIDPANPTISRTTRVCESAIGAWDVWSNCDIVVTDGTDRMNKVAPRRLGLSKKTSSRVSSTIVCRAPTLAPVSLRLSSLAKSTTTWAEVSRRSTTTCSPIDCQLVSSLPRTLCSVASLPKTPKISTSFLSKPNEQACPCKADHRLLFKWD